MVELSGPVVGVDVFAKGWVAVVLRPGTSPQVTAHDALAEVLSAYGEALVVGADIPIGLPTEGVRRADREARRFLREGRTSSVYDAPPRAVLTAATYGQARQVALEVWGRGVSAQSYRLGARILEAEGLAATDRRLIEVHPEVSFTAMAGAPLPDSKKSWNGQMARRRLLEEAGISLDDRLPVTGSVPPDDILDAAAVAWTAARHSRREARSLPDPPEVGADGTPMAIWY